MSARLRGHRVPAWTAATVAMSLLSAVGCASADNGAAAATATPQGAVTGPVVDGTFGQTLYVPVYSHIYYREAGRKIDLTVTLSVRNTDPRRSITVPRVDYYDSNGALVRRYAEAPFALGPLATRSIVVEQMDREGGSGANFLVDWAAAEPTSPPVVEAIMISVASSSGVSFVSPARVVEDRTGPGAMPVSDEPQP